MSVQSRYVDGSYAEANPGWFSERSEWKANQVALLLDDAGVCPSSIVDVGCGTGLPLYHLASRFDCVEASLGLEPSSHAPNLVPDGRVPIRRDSVESLDQHFDVAMMLDVFEHVEDYLGFIRSVRGTANWYLFHIPLDVFTLCVATGRLGRTRAQSGHIHYFTFETALATLREAGMEPTHWRFTPAAFDGPDRSKTRPPINLARLVGYRMSPRLTARWLGGIALAVLARES